MRLRKPIKSPFFFIAIIGLVIEFLLSLYYTAEGGGMGIAIVGLIPAMGGNVFAPAF